MPAHCSPAPPAPAVVRRSQTSWPRSGTSRTGERKPPSRHARAGKPEWASIALNEKALLDEFSPATLASLRELYAEIPGGGCAIDEQGGALKLNLACPRLRNDICAAAADLAQAFMEARASA